MHDPNKKTTVFERTKEALQWKNYRHVLLFNCIIAFVLTVTNMDGGVRETAIDASLHLLYSMCIGCSIYLLSFALDLDRLKNRFAFLLGLAGTFLVGGLSGALLAAWISTIFWDVSNPISRLSPFLWSAGIMSLIFGAMGFAYFYFQGKLQWTAEQLAEKEINEQKLSALKTEAELDALRASVQPHFLFNSLNSIASLIHSDPDLAEELVQKLSDLLRVAIRTGREEWVDLQEEIALVDAYLFIEKARLGERLSFEIQVPKQLRDVPIPALLLQPLVENSIKHGIAPRRQGGQLLVKCSDLGDRCRIEISDNGRGWDPNTYTEGFGLRGVKERLALNYKNRCHWQINNEEGVHILIEIPKGKEAIAG